MGFRPVAILLFFLFLFIILSLFTIDWQILEASIRRSIIVFLMEILVAPSVVLIATAK